MNALFPFTFLIARFCLGGPSGTTGSGVDRLTQRPRGAPGTGIRHESWTAGPRAFPADIVDPN
jgi:hypothetical protein